MLAHDPPQIDGTEIVGSLRSWGVTTPAIFFTDQEEKDIRGPRGFATYYLKKGQVQRRTMDDLARLIRDAARRGWSGNAIEEGKRTFSELIDGMPDPFFSLDEGLRVSGLNRAAESIIGAPSEECIGAGFSSEFIDLEGSYVEEKCKGRPPDRSFQEGDLPDKYRERAEDLRYTHPTEP